MINDPLEECPPDDPMESVTIVAKLDAKGIWSVHCPEWKCELHDKSLTRAVAILCAEIENHNDECNGEPTTQILFEKWLDRKGMAKLKPEQYLKPAPAQRNNAAARKSKPIHPDDTSSIQRDHSNTSMWQRL